MILYHGSNVEIQRVDLGKCRPYKDFGKGFYLTDIPHQAERMAARTAKMFKGNPIITRFDFDLQKAIEQGLNIKVFNSPDEEWARFVMSNRDINAPQPSHDYDIVIGPVADDTIARLLRMFTENFIDEKQLVKELTFSKVTSQYFFHTEAAIKMLKKIMNENNAQYLFEGISADVVRYLVERDGMELGKAIAVFHNSETFSKLEDFDTGLYIESPAYVYDLLQSELKYGRLVP